MAELSRRKTTYLRVDWSNESYDSGSMVTCSIRWANVMSSRASNGVRFEDNVWLEAKFSSCTFDNVVMRKDYYHTCTFWNIVLTDCNAGRVSAEKSRFVGCKWENGIYTGSTFRKCNFLHLTVSHASVGNMLFKDCVFRDTELEDVEFYNVVFKNCQFGRMPEERNGCKFIRCREL